MFKLSNFPFYNYKVIEKLQQTDIGKTRFSLIKKNYRTIKNSLKEPLEIINIDLKSGEDATICCNDITNLKVFLDNLDLKFYKYSNSNLEIIKITNPDLNENLKQNLIKYFKINLLKYGFKIKEIKDLKKDLEFFQNKFQDDSNIKEYIFFNRLITSKNKLLIFYNYFPGSIFKKHYKNILNNNIIIHLSTNLDHYKSKYNYKVEIQNSENLIENDNIDFDEEEEII